MSENQKKEKLNELVKNFYESDLLIEFLNEEVGLNENSKTIGLILLRIFWKVKMDLDLNGNEYKNEEIDGEEVYNLISNKIDLIDINHRTYKQYFKDLLKVVYYLIKNSD